MKIEIEVNKRIEFDVKYLEVNANVRYPEDARINGVEDKDGNLMPFLKNGTWNLLVELETGMIKDWPEGISANVHYKVCDGGEYFLRANNHSRVAKYTGDYVPDFLGIEDESYGDYICLKIDESGKINKWNSKKVLEADWEIHD